ncbi:hypothetical protein AUP42_15375 [Thalassospira lucentensis]|uniref:Diguanylate phosphodiesterase n=1 Tax=Thalassospira lucentensis TaxID=168935 RepID=A0A154L8L8_9PROT|nr:MULTISPECIES: EAL domain-containing response regulator [Thalassospira]KZB66904.1 hypothetical protein AUP42_15375 [Thalassospira lucentensis]MCH2273543.1 EAL domain-containing response regulator [Thalassospira sp.]
MRVATIDLPTVMMVDDDENLLASVCRSLSGSFNLVKYINGEAALEWLSKNRSGVQVIVADLVMPTIDGINFLKRACHCAPDVPRILLTGNVSAVPLREAKEHAKVSQILTKPISSMALKEVLARTIGDRCKEGHVENVMPDIVNAAIDRSDFTTVIQPRVRTSDFMRTGGEVLCRMPDLQKRFDIGQIFEGCRNQPVMNRLTMHIMETMIDLAPLYREALGPSARISMNVDPCLVSNNRFVCSMSDFIDEMQESGLEIELEINEKQLNVMDENFAKNAKFLARRGTRLFIDGFGADKAAFELLRNEYFAGVKLDQGLIGRMMGNRSDDAFVSWIVQICRQIGYSVIAVGVENEATALCLREYGVEELQGYLFGMPQPLEELVPGKIAI